jgi:hypothetical protein
MENAAELSDAELALLLAMDRAARILRSDGSAAPRGAPGMALPKPTSNQGPSSSDDSREPNAEPNAEALAASHAPGHNASRGALRPQRRRYLENCTAPPGLPRVVHCIPRVPSHHASAVDDFVPFSPRGVEHGSRTPVATIPCYASASGRVAYVKAAKAASTLLLALLRREFPDLGQLSNCERLEGYTFFTSAREPLERVRSAYGEVDARIAIRHRPPNVSYYLMPHAHEPARFLTFLDEVFHQRFSSKDYQVFCLYCMCVYMHACMHACMHVCMYVCMHACMSRVQVSAGMPPDRTALLFLTLFLTPPLFQVLGGSRSTTTLPHYQTTTLPNYHALILPGHGRDAATCGATGAPPHAHRALDARHGSRAAQRAAASRLGGAAGAGQAGVKSARGTARLPRGRGEAHAGVE